MSYIPGDSRETVKAQAGNCCEYCRLNQEDYAYPFHIEHIISQKHEGQNRSINATRTSYYMIAQDE